MSQDYLRATYSEMAEQLQRALGIQGPLPDAVDPMIEPSVTLLDMRDPDMLWLRRQSRYMSGQNLNATAAQNSVIELENPVGGNTLMTVRPTVFNNNAAAVFYTMVPVSGAARLAGGVAQRSCNLDQRQPWSSGAISPFPVAVVRAQNLVLAAINGPVVYVGIGGYYTFPPVVLPPGSALSFQSLSVNVGIVVAFEWTERQQQPMES